MADGGKAAQEAATIEKSPLVRFEAVTKRFGSVVAVEALSLDIEHGEFFALLGPSGCGKTTLVADAGRIRSADRRPHPARRRRYRPGAAAPATGEYDVPELRVVSALER